MIRDIFVCWSKEFKFYFQSKMIYLVLFIYGVMLSALMLYASDFEQYSSVNMYQFFRYQPGLLATVIPALTMRFWADEYKYNTLELLLAQPVNLWAIVGGKFLAVWAVVAIMIFMSCGLWGIMAGILPLDNLWILINYLVTLLMAGSLCAIASMMAAFCYNMVGAFLAAMAMCMLTVMANFGEWISEILPNNWILNKVFIAFDFKTQFDNIIMGQINISALIYFVLIICIALLVTKVVVEYKRS